MVGYLCWLFHLLIWWPLFIERTEASIRSQYETKQERKWQQSRGVGNAAKAEVHVVILPYPAKGHSCFLSAPQQKPCSPPFPWAPEVWPVCPALLPPEVLVTAGCLILPHLRNSTSMEYLVLKKKLVRKIFWDGMRGMKRKSLRVLRRSFLLLCSWL